MPILEFESRGGLSLMERFRTARDMITSSQSREMLRHLFVWLRFSQTRQLSWQRRHNTKPRELADEIQILSEVVAKYWKSSQSASDRDILRMMLSTIPRGGGDGQRIRDEILVIMRKFEIKKRKGTWMEEWHQKLHNNCTPDDIYICEAYIKFLQSNGDLKAFYSHLSKFGLDKQRLQTFERPILQDPIFFPSIKNGLINELSNYLQILKSVHAGADLEHSHDLCRGFLPGNLNALVEAVKVERTHPSPAYQETFTSFFNSVAARRLLWESILHEQHVPKVRDLLYLDIALQDQSRMMVEGVLSTSSSVDEDLDSSLLSLTSELVEILRDWSSLLQTVGINMEEWKSKSHRHALLAAAYLDRLERMLSQLADRCHRLFQPIAEQLGGSIRRRNPDKTPETWNIAMFTEGVVRGGVGFAVSLIHQKAVQAFRRSGVLPSWQVISPGSRRARGVVMIADVKDVQFKSFDCPTVLLSSRVSGEEEIPEGVVAVITQDSPDVLSHIAVRARNTHVMFASCFDLASFHQFLDFDGKDVVCQVLEQRVSIEMAEGAMDDMVDSHTSHGSSRRMEEEEEERSTPPSKFVYLESEILEEGKKVAGGKTMNLLNVRRRLPDWIKTPKSALIPFGVFQYVLQHQDNRDSQRKYAEIVKQLGVLDAEDIPSKLQDIKNIILDLKVPDEVRADIARSLQDGVFRQVVVDEQESLDCIKRVWSSVWNERAFLSCKKAGISNERIRMAVLLQQIVEAEYAFVVHTVNPLNLDPSEIYIEIAKGHGEAIVGNFPGRSLSVVCRRGSHEVLRIESMPSKSVMLRARGLVFRSDSDAEDLHDFAGAGLFDSVPLVDYEREIIGYRKDPIIQTTSELDKLVMNICKLAEEVEGAMGGKPQDIEGCWSGGSPYVVQSRPQVKRIRSLHDLMLPRSRSGFERERGFECEECGYV
ncbi:hypothetical protein GUITHDRAFT_62607 [Guillardia theta CCMP2712]|uniref:Pyruvate phosphate dikinase AMP/ATP-binding domain-containing protein n=1 Tax=Guillardia theta (strain CCMP2712) TaxID=905079 RepID=L1K4D7_GUITC|nr:hypothetical protein GUITHDRAFT_62607 [Guillardia theta CCMP2712]EKX55447.1 hypothetical protein GUITHDRAFT_62607 [Guillardia theta CCMP2712]|eukprot:XP_005842427.1 hypothetical protein GUITHDRAFT_62607 [Guillardia theta CCMP2712]